MFLNKSNIFNIFFLFNFILIISNCQVKSSNFGYNRCIHYTNKNSCKINNCIWCNFTYPVCKEINSCFKNNVTEFCYLSLTDEWFCNFSIISIALIILFSILINYSLCKIIEQIVNKSISQSIFLMIIMIPNLILVNFNIHLFFYYSIGNLALLILVYTISSFIN